MPLGRLEPVERATRDGGVELDARVAALHRRVGAAGHDRPRVDEALPGIGALQARVAQALGREIEVADGVARLHRGNDPEFGEARNVGGTDDLGVLDAPARRIDRALGRRHRRERFLVPVERQVIAAIADGVGGDLDAALEVRLHHRQGIGFLHLQEAGVARRIRIGFEQGRAARSQRAVHEELHHARDHPPVRRRMRTVGEERFSVTPVDGVVDLQRRFPARVEAFDDRYVGVVDVEVVHSGPAIGRIDLECGAIGLDLEGLRLHRLDLCDQLHGGVDQHAVGVAGLVFQHLAAERDRRVARDPRELQRRGVGDQRMAVGAVQDHRIVRRHGVEVIAIGETRLGPVRLDPVHADDDLALRGLGDPRLQPLHRVGQRGGAFEVKHQFALADVAQVRVGVGEARKQRRAVQVDHLGRVALQCLRARAIASIDHSAIAHSDRLDLGPRVIVGVDRPAPDHRVGGRRPLGLGRRAQGEDAHGDQSE